MRGRWLAGVSVLMCGCIAAALGDDVRWRAAVTPPSAPNSSDATVQPSVNLGQPTWVGINPGTPMPRDRNVDGLPPAPATASPIPTTAVPVASSRNQIAATGIVPIQYDAPPPAPPPGSTVAPPPPAGIAPLPPPPPPVGPDYGSGPAGPSDGGFFKNCWQKIEWGSCSGSGRTLFQSDHGFDNMISPVSSPFLNEDPRSLTELRPIFIWEATPRHNSTFDGGSVFFLGTQARLAVTERISVVMSELGAIWQEPNNPTPYFQREGGLAELRIGPKFTFLRDECSRTLGAFGVTFDIPLGSSRVEQNNGSLSVAPYFTFAHSFAGSSYGNFNAQGTIGYNFSVNQERSEFLFMNLHLDYDIAGAHKIYPLIELNFLHYGRGGNNTNVNGFEGGDLFNFGAQAVSSSNDLTMALGARYKFCECAQVGFALEFPLAGAKDLDGFRITTDFILRY
jgi:hypothetical protein